MMMDDGEMIDVIRREVEIRSRGEHVTQSKKTTWGLTKRIKFPTGCRYKFKNFWGPICIPLETVFLVASKQVVMILLWSEARQDLQKQDDDEITSTPTNP